MRLSALTCSPEVLATLTQDIGKVFAALHDSKIAGSISLATGINVAQVCMLTVLSRSARFEAPTK